MDGLGTAPRREKRRSPFAIVLPTYSFSVAAYAEVWGYDGIVNDERTDLVDDETGFVIKWDRFKPE